MMIKLKRLYFQYADNYIYIVGETDDKEIVIEELPVTQHTQIDMGVLRNIAERHGYTI